MTNHKWRSQRLDRLGSAIFAEVSAWKAEARAQGVDVISLDIGSPDRPPLAPIREALAEASLKPDMYRYPGTEGSARFRAKAAEWFAHRFGVALDPSKEILSLMGTQDGLAHLALAATNPGDSVMLPDPGYPVYQAGLAVAGVETIPLPLLADNGYLPDFDAIPDAHWDKTKFMLLSYPSNPVTTVADLAFFERAVAVAKRRGVLLVHDNAYSEMAYDGFRPPSVLQVPGASEIAIEFHSMSKSFHLAGGRIGFAVGNAQVLDALRDLKNNIDFGVFLAVQEAAVAALELDMRDPHPVASIYEARRNAFVRAMREEGWDFPPPRGTMFAWAPVPAGWSSRQISRAMLAHAGVAVIPGRAFGERGEGYVRFALVEEEERLREAAQRIGRFLREHEPVSDGHSDY
ncbi:aminotransferase class I/II-fold pyridoxal phosphate-dependent enzyme [Cohnella sp. REN36]|uniref:aminotransferase class I/II-fold pyridoxal phosphate-dependent enzyme n=1 Tax=Cohnella sp. REN36 TaxID=2887347 RepID=UPI001D156C09|nr:aminotransferase class I/II-fold pyridoxal phosphate-dependent enzyme [Cohnella sp. REN36]MCC3377098.1 aminotransferase class I/II-fold pyridoxal phosphate-dependent enzyme [Cohnella sp. REN36]